MAAPRPPLLGLEAFEDRTLPSGAAFHPDQPLAPSGGWSPIPAHTRYIADPSPGAQTDSAVRAEQNVLPASGANSEFVALTRMLAVMAAIARESEVVVPVAARPVQVVPSAASLAAPDAEPRPGPAQPPQNPQGPLAPAFVPQQALPNGPAVPGAVPLMAVPVAMQPTASYSGSDEPEPRSAAPSEPRAAVPVPSAPVAAPQPKTVSPLAEWLPIDVTLPRAAPLAGLLGFDGEGLDEEVRRLLALTTGIGVDEGGGSAWYWWLATGAALAGGAGYAMWSNRPARMARSVATRGGSLSWEERDDVGVR